VRRRRYVVCGIFVNYSPGADKYYDFTEFACQLNEPEAGVAPTDSRLRPDQRLMEDGRWDEANTEKCRLEDKQRAAKKKRDAELEKIQSSGGIRKIRIKKLV